MFDALATTVDEVAIRRDPSCPVCGESPTITEVLNYVQFNTQDLISTFRRKIANAGTRITRPEANAFIADYIAGLAGYTYLEGAVR